MHRGRPAGKPDAAADRKAGLLRADAIHQDLPSGTTAPAAVPEQIRNLARRLEQDIKLPA